MAIKNGKPNRIFMDSEERLGKLAWFANAATNLVAGDLCLSFSHGNSELVSRIPLTSCSLTPGVAPPCFRARSSIK